MKLKDRPLEWWHGKKFTYWCRADKNDQRKIHYTLKGIWEGKKQEAHFTSEDDVDAFMMYRIQNSIIESIDMVNNEWIAVLIY